MILRRRDLLLAAGAAGAAGLPLPAASQGKPFTVITPFGYIADFGELMNGVAGRHFARHGLDVKVLGGNGTATAVAQVIAGQARITRTGSIDVLQAAKAGGTGRPSLVAIATLYQGSTFHVISDRNRPVDSVEAMKGRTVGIVSVGGTTELLVDAMLASRGLRPADVKKEVVGNNAGAFALIGQGRIDCFVATIAVVQALQQAGAAVSIFSTDRYAPMPSQCYSVTPETLEKEADSVVAWLRGLRDSVNEMMTADYGTLLERMGRSFEIPGIRNAAALKATHEAAVKLWLSQGRENLLRNVPALWAQGAEVLGKAGIVKVDRVTDYYTNALVDRALKP